MKRILAFGCLLAIVGLSEACGAVVETNANRNANASTVPANVGVVANNNGNKNTAGVNGINGNSNQNGAP